MQLQVLEPGETIGAQRGEVVVCIPVYGAHEHFVACLGSVLEHTANEVPILVCDDASPDPRSAEHVRSLARGEGLEATLLYMRRERNVGYPANANAALASAAPADVVLLNSDCVVAAGWLEGLREAAHADSTVATATALTNHGTIVSVPERFVPLRELPDHWTIDDAAAAVRSHSLRLRPRLLTAVGHCVYVRRSALELVGDFDLSFSPGYGEEVDFSQRCLRYGLRHVAADDVLVLHHGGGSFARDGAPHPVQAEHEEMLARRYPYYHDAVRASEEDLAGPLTRALGVARRALMGLTVTIDARGGSDGSNEAQAHALAEALARTGHARASVLTASDARASRADVVHRLFPFEREEELRSARQLAERLIVSQPDLINYENPSYFESFSEWERHRRLTRAALAVADAAVFPAEPARADALAEELLAEERASVVPSGVDGMLRGDMEPPPGAAALSEHELILVLGSDRRHRNRPFTLHLFEALQARADWPGMLVLAGPRVRHGSSAAEEEALLAERPRLRARVAVLGEASPAHTRWLLARAALVIDAAVGERFGVVPFAAAEHDVPCLWPGDSWLSELVDADGGIVAWDAELSAQRALELVRDEGARARNVSAIRAAGAMLTWDVTAARLLDVYRVTCNSPASSARLTTAGEEPVTAPVHFSADAVRLLGPAGALAPDLERPLLALATHPRLGQPVFGAIKGSYRASLRLRRLLGERRGRRERAG